MSSRQLKKFEEAVNQYQKSIINFHYRLVGDKFEAENLAQETFIKVYLKFKTLRSKKKLKSWIFGIARNLVIDYFRKNKNREIAFAGNLVENLTETVEANQTNVQDQIDSDEIARELGKCIDQLSPQDGVLIKLLYFEGFSYKEISELLKMNQNTLKSRLHRARMDLLAMIRSNDLFQGMFREA